jgi:methyltransferase (TIGR00027 family)
MPLFLRRIEDFVDWRWPGVRQSAQSRTRVIDDLLRQALAAGIAQLVILGAGYDTRAHRMAELSTATVFEVDHPATLAHKRELAAAWPRLAASLRYVPVDFEADDLPARLRDSGFQRDRPAFFVWEGVTPYLDEASVNRTLGFVGACAPDSELVFTYVHRAVLDGSRTFKGAASLLRTLKRSREPWKFGFDPATLAGDIEKHGLALVWDSSTVAQRPDAPPGFEHFRIAHARVQGPPAGRG